MMGKLCNVSFLVILVFFIDIVSYAQSTSELVKSNAFVLQASDVLSPSTYPVKNTGFTFVYVNGDEAILQWQDPHRGNNGLGGFTQFCNISKISFKELHGKNDMLFRYRLNCSSLDQMYYVVITVLVDGSARAQIRRRDNRQIYFFGNILPIEKSNIQIGTDMPINSFRDNRNSKESWVTKSPNGDKTYVQ